MLLLPLSLLQGGASTVVGTVADTSLPDVAAVVAAVAITGTDADTQQPNAAAVAAKVAITGAVADTQQLNTAAASGTVGAGAINGTVADTQQPNVAAVVAAVKVAGAVADSQLANISAASGSIGSTIIGTVADTQLPNYGPPTWIVSVYLTFAGAAVGKPNTLTASGTVMTYDYGALFETQQLNVCAASGSVVTPDISYRVGNNAGTDDLLGEQDTWLNSTNVTQNNGTSTSFQVDASTTNPLHGLMKFSGLSVMSTYAPVVVSAATIYIYNAVAGSGTSPQTFSLYSLLKPWTDSGATWNTYDGTTNWATAGAQGAADRDAVAVLAQSVTTAVSTGITGGKPFSGGTLPALVQSWINGTKSNYGLLFKRTDASNDGATMFLASTEGVGAPYKPYLQFSWHSIGSISGSMSFGYQDQLPNVSTASGSIFNGVIGTVADAGLPNFATASAFAQPPATGTVASTQQINVAAAAAKVGVSGTAATHDTKQIVLGSGQVLTLGIVARTQNKNVAAGTGNVLALGAYTTGAPERFYSINAEHRSFTIPPVPTIASVANDRAMTFNAEHRTDGSILAEHRTMSFNAEHRTLVSTPEHRTDPI